MADRAGLVSVVINFLDAEKFIAEAIASVYEQSYPSWELLLIDDGSSDRSSAIAMRHAKVDSARVRYLEHPGHENRGTSASRNLGIMRARGELIAFLDADDVCRPQRLEQGAALLRSNPSADMVYGESEYWRSWQADGGAHADRVQPQGFAANRVVAAPELLVRYLIHRAAVPCPSSMMARSRALRDCGGFVESFRGLHDDQAFLARFCLDHDVFVSHECWDRYRQHDASMCAQAARQGGVNAAQQAYLAWLRGFLEERAVRDRRVWDALRYAELVSRYQRPGLGNKVARSALGLFMSLKLALRPSGTLPPR